MKKITYLIGIVSLLALVIILILSFKMTTENNDDDGQNSSENAKIIFEGDLVYDGTGELDLLDGVSAIDEDGTDLTSNINAKIVLDGNELCITYVGDIDIYKTFGDFEIPLEYQDREYVKLKIIESIQEILNPGVKKVKKKKL